MSMNFTKEDCKKLIIVMLLTDGCVGEVNQGKYVYTKISYWSKDKILKNTFIKLMKIAFNFNPSHIGKEEVYFKRKNETAKIMSELRRISRDLNKQSDKVSLNFLRLSNRNVILYALRLAMSGEGSISFARRKSGGFCFNLAFACANYKLCNEWQKLFDIFEIYLKIRKDAAVYSGYHGLQTVSEKSILNFHKIGGFINDVKVQKGRRFRNFDKNYVLGICAKVINKKHKGEFKGYTKWTDEVFWNAVDDAEVPKLGQRGKTQVI